MTTLMWRMVRVRISGCTTGPNPANAAAAYRAFLGGLYGGCGAVTATCTTLGGPEGGGILAAGKAGLQLATNGSNINPVAINILQAPGAAGGYSQGFYISGAPKSCAAPCQLNIEDPAFVTEAQYLANLDYHMSDKNTLSERFMTSWEPEVAPLGSPMTGGGYDENFGGDFAVLRLTSILNNNLVNEARAGYFRITATLLPTYFLNSCSVGIIPSLTNAPDPAVSGSQQCSNPAGANYVAPPLGGPPADQQMPGITVSGTSETASGTYPVGTFGLGNAGHENSWLTINEFSGGDQLSWNHGKHSIRVGGDYERDQTNYVEPYTVEGTESFRTFQDFLWGSSTNPVGGSTTGVSALSAVGGARYGQYGLRPLGCAPIPSTGYVQDDIKLDKPAHCECWSPI